MKPVLRGTDGRINTNRACLQSWLKLPRKNVRAFGAWHVSRVTPSLMSRLLSTLILAILSVPAFAGGGPTVPGDIAYFQNGVACAPANAPQAVKEAIWALNTIQAKPYRWGGGHATFSDIGYDCSGTVSFMLHHAGVLEAPTPSRAFLSWGEEGPGRWITIYARAGHVFAVIAGLRIDTTGRREQEGPRWRAEFRNPTGFVARHPAGL